MSQLDILCRKFDLLFAEIAHEGLENDFLRYLEKDYEIYDFCRARGLVLAEGR